MHASGDEGDRTVPVRYEGLTHALRPEQIARLEEELMRIDAAEQEAAPFLADDRVAGRLARGMRRLARDPPSPAEPSVDATGETRPGIDPLDTIGRPELLAEIPVPQRVDDLIEAYVRVMGSDGASPWRIDDGRTTSLMQRPAPERVPLLLRAAVEVRSDGLHPAACASLLEGELLAIRPFVRGNGTVARLLARAYLQRAGYKVATFLPWPIDRDHRQVEERVLAEAAEREDPTIWLAHSLERLATAFTDVRTEAAFVAEHVEALNERQWRLASWFRMQSGHRPDRSWRFREIHASLPWVAPRTLKRDLSRLREREILLMEGRLKSARYQYVADPPPRFLLPVDRRTLDTS